MMACPLYSDPRKKFLGTILTNLDPSTVMDQVIFLIVDVLPELSYEVALFALKGKKILTKLVPVYVSCF